MDVRNLVMPLSFYFNATLKGVDPKLRKAKSRLLFFLQIICASLCVVKQNHNIKILSNDVDRKCQIFWQFNKYVMSMNGKTFNICVKYVKEVQKTNIFCLKS